MFNLSIQPYGGLGCRRQMTWGAVVVGVAGTAYSAYNASQADTPQYGSVQAPQVMSGQDAYSGAQNWLGSNGYGSQLTAQSNALNQIATPQAAQQYYSSFQPTSFENALAQQQFQNVWPQQQAFMQDQLSKSGMSYSPVEAATLGQAYGNTATGIGEYLNTQANNRANTVLSSNLSINPMNYLSPIADANQNASGKNAQNSMNAQMTNNSADYDNQLMNYKQQLAQGQAIGSIASSIGGGMLQSGMFSGGGNTAQSVSSSPSDTSGSSSPYSASGSYGQNLSSGIMGGSPELMKTTQSVY